MLKMNKKVILIIAIAVLLVAGGTTTFFLTRDIGLAAIINGVKITNETVEEEMDKAMGQYAAQGMVLQEEQILEMRTSVLDNLIIREVLLQNSNSIELEADDVENQISSFKANFNTEEEFLERIAQEGFSLESFTNIITEDLKIKKLVENGVPKEVEITEEEILNFYNENPSYFTKPERIHASHILVEMKNDFSDEQKGVALEKINKLEAMIKNGADFAKLAKDESEGPSSSSGGDLGEFQRGQMVAAFDEIAFSLPVGNVSGVVETQFGYHLIKLHERFAESKDLMEVVKESIYSYLEQEKNQNKLNDYLDTLKAEAKIRIPKYKLPNEKEEEKKVNEPETSELETDSVE